MNELMKNAALVSLEEWNAIHDAMWKTFTIPENPPLSAAAFQAAAKNVQPQPEEA